MGLLCPKCLDYSLNIEDKLELPPDSRSDEITLQIIKCKKCSFEGVAVYEESRRGNLDDYSYNHTGYELPTSSLNQIKRDLSKKPWVFEVYNENNKWVWISSQHIKDIFPIKMKKHNR